MSKKLLCPLLRQLVNSEVVLIYFQGSRLATIKLQFVITFGDSAAVLLVNMVHPF